MTGARKRRGSCEIDPSPVNVYLERIEVAPEEVEWQDGLEGDVAYCRERGWKVNGR